MTPAAPACLIFAAVLTILPASASEKAALVLGIDAYPDVPLANAVRDARAVRDMLTGELGFPAAGIVYAEDADRLTVFEKFEAFKVIAAKADIVLVFYAGHGMESLDGKENFLLPVDAKVTLAAESEAALRASGINLMSLTSDLAKATTGAKVILMDCCRERPAGRGVVRAGGGLVNYADAEIPADTLMILAAAPNRVASDGKSHGPFTEALLEVLPDNRDNLMEAFFAVSDRVREVTENQQVPWLKFDGSGHIFRRQHFLGMSLPPEVAPVPMVPDAPSVPVQAPSDRLRRATKESPFVNSLGLEFVPVPGKDGVWMSRTETRVRDFRVYAEATDYVQTGGAYVLKVNKAVEGGYPTAWEMDEKASWEKPGFGQSEDHPVVCVGWEEARSMAAWLSGVEEGPLVYRLPTDSEWTSAVGSVDKYPWGNAWPPPKGSGNYSGKEWPGVPQGSARPIEHLPDDGAERTARVASYTENRFGFHDLGGNVWEWFEDQYSQRMNEVDTMEATPGLRNQKLTNGTTLRALRGGSWSSLGEVYFRSSCRVLDLSSIRCDSYGFRLVVVVGGGG